jgi:uncharacterized protein
MKTTIGRCLNESKIRQRYSLAGAAAIIVVDLLFITFHFGQAARSCLAIIALATIIAGLDGELNSAGFRLTPRQRWAAWIRTSAIIGLAVCLCIGATATGMHLTGHKLPIHITPPHNLMHQFISMCFVAPVMEETLYRFVICVPLVGLLGEWRTIAVSGLLFAALHVVYGNPSPENMVGGFFLAWAFLKSETILIPVLLHSIGNSIALAGQVAGWYFFTQT